MAGASSPNPLVRAPSLQLNHLQPPPTVLFLPFQWSSTRLLTVLSLRCTRHASAPAFSWGPIGRKMPHWPGTRRHHSCLTSKHLRLPEAVSNGRRALLTGLNPDLTRFRVYDDSFCHHHGPDVSTVRCGHCGHRATKLAVACRSSQHHASGRGDGQRCQVPSGRDEGLVVQGAACIPALTNVLVIIRTLVLACATDTRPRQGDLHSTTS